MEEVATETNEMNALIESSGDNNSSDESQMEVFGINRGELTPATNSRLERNGVSNQEPVEGASSMFDGDEVQRVVLSVGNSVR